MLGKILHQSKIWVTNDIKELDLCSRKVTWRSHDPFSVVLLLELVASLGRRLGSGEQLVVRLVCDMRGEEKGDGKGAGTL